MRVGCTDHLTTEYRDTPYCRGAEANFDQYAGASGRAAGTMVITRYTTQQAINCWRERRPDTKRLIRTLLQLMATKDYQEGVLKAHDASQWYESVARVTH